MRAGSLLLAVAGMAMLGGCTGQPRTYSGPRSYYAAPARTRPAVIRTVEPTQRAATTLTPAEKERLFRSFEQSQRDKQPEPVAAPSGTP